MWGGASSIRALRARFFDHGWSSLNGGLSGAARVEPPGVGSLLRLYRVRDWLHFAALPLATFDATAPLAGGLWAAARGLASAFALLAFGYLLNSVSDRHLDLDPRKNPLIVPGTGSARYSLAVLFLVILALAVAAPVPAQFATAICLVCYIVYSAGPRLKAIPIVGSLINIGLFTPLLFLGLRDATLPAGFWAVMVVCSALVLETQVIHEAADQLEDRAGGVQTTWLMLGAHRTAVIAALAGIAAAIGAARMIPPAYAGAAAALVAAVFGVAFPLLLARYGSDPAHAARLRITHRWCGVALGAGLFVVWRWTA